MVLFSDLSIGEMIAVFSYLWFMMAPVQDILNIQYAYYSAKAALGRINELLYLPNEPKYKHELNPFEDVCTALLTLESKPNIIKLLPEFFQRGYIDNFSLS